MMMAAPGVTSDKYWLEDEPVYYFDGDHHVSVFSLTDKGKQNKHFADKSPLVLTD